MKKKKFVSKPGSKVHLVKEVDHSNVYTVTGTAYITLCGRVLCDYDGYELRNTIGANLHCINCSRIEGAAEHMEAGGSYLAVVDPFSDAQTEPVPILGGLAHIQHELINRFGETSAVDLLDENRVKFYHIRKVTVDPTIKVIKKLLELNVHTTR